MYIIIKQRGQSQPGERNMTIQKTKVQTSDSFVAIHRIFKTGHARVAMPLGLIFKSSCNIVSKISSFYRLGNKNRKVQHAKL